MRRPKWTGEILNLHIKVTKITNRRVTPCKHKYLHTPPTHPPGNHLDPPPHSYMKPRILATHLRNLRNQLFSKVIRTNRENNKNPVKCGSMDMYRSEGRRDRGIYM